MRLCGDGHELLKSWQQLHLKEHHSRNPQVGKPMFGKKRKRKRKNADVAESSVTLPVSTSQPRKPWRMPETPEEMAQIPVRGVEFYRTSGG